MSFPIVARKRATPEGAALWRSSMVIGLFMQLQYATCD